MHTLYYTLPKSNDLDHDQSRQRGATGQAVAASASPLASLAAITAIKNGGSAADAVVAAQAVLGLVEPHASGFGGGTVIVWHDERTGASGVIDGLAASPASVTDSLERDFDGRAIPRERAMSGGRTVGVPGTLRALENLHKRFGKQPWAKAFDPARQHATEGFSIPPYLIKTITEIGSIQDERLAHEIYCGGKRRVMPEGSIIRNAAYAKTLSIVAEQGASAFYEGDIAEELIAVVNGDLFPGRMTRQDLADYTALDKAPATYDFNGAKILTAPAPVFGGIAVGQIVQMMESLGFAGQDLGDSADLTHAVMQAGRLAFSDRGAYIGEQTPTSVQAALLDPAYLAERAKLIDLRQVMGSVKHGQLGADMPAGPDGTGLTSAMTSHLVICDGDGLTISMTTTINQNFGSRLSVRGFYLNNVQTNFAAKSGSETGTRAYNAMAARKRPMTSFAPSIMLNPGGSVRAALGAGGGNRIVGFVANALLRIAAGYEDAQQIVSAPQALSWTALSNIEPGLGKLSQALTQRGHYLMARRMDGGTQVALKQGNSWNAGADIRRDGTAVALIE